MIKRFTLNVNLTRNFKRKSRTPTWNYIKSAENSSRDSKRPTNTRKTRKNIDADDGGDDDDETHSGDKTVNTLINFLSTIFTGLTCRLK